ncbi:protein of unknown function [Candidatus Nitrosotalea okcheonensis]|uniref:Uncharacterized protein n=1 Tax=Candidatus Nitrosotalea okcheonensis TaxID=1903276 RepID=A0A2H1FEB9_9ARCH|nr:protein of unknown function [Candidatus Nitrosotalea okcheonensis]
MFVIIILPMKVKLFEEFIAMFRRKPKSKGLLKSYFLLRSIHNQKTDHLTCVSPLSVNM